MQVATYMRQRLRQTREPEEDDECSYMQVSTGDTAFNAVLVQLQRAMEGMSQEQARLRARGLLQRLRSTQQMRPMVLQDSSCESRDRLQRLEALLVLFQSDISQPSGSQEAPLEGTALEWVQARWNTLHVFMRPWWQERADVQGAAVVEVEESQGSAGSREEYRVRETNGTEREVTEVEYQQ